MDLPSFDTLREMAENRPGELDALQKSLTDKLIEGAPEEIQKRLRGLQFKVEMEKQRSKTPLARCVRLSQMMHESFDQLRVILNDMTTGESNYESNYQVANAVAADVIPFPAR